MEVFAVAAVIGLLVFWKKSPLQGLLHPAPKQLMGTDTNTAANDAQSAVAMNPPGNAGGIGTRPPLNPEQQAAQWTGLGINLFGQLANAVKGLAGSSSTSGFPYGSSTGGPSTYPDGTIGGPQVGQDNASNDANFPGYDPNGGYNPGTSQAATGNYDDGSISGGNDGYWNAGNDPWGASDGGQPLDPYNTSNADVGGGVDTSGSNDGMV